MTEEEFNDLVDCRWPYKDIQRSRELITTAANISPNAAFIALHELCCLPKSARAKKAELLTLVDFWLGEFDHPLAPSMAVCAKWMIKNQALSDQEALVMMRAIKSYPGLYAALAIACCSSDDKHGLLDAYNRDVRAFWEGTLPATSR